MLWPNEVESPSDLVKICHSKWNEMFV